MRNIITLKYEFSMHNRTGLEQINRLLSVMPLEDLDAENVHATLNTTWHMSEQGARQCVSDDVGLSWGEICCYLHTGEGEGRIYRMDADVVDCPPEGVQQSYEAAWCAAHPDRELAFVNCSKYGDRTIVLIGHCGKIS